jgi:hypothetical protein
VPTFSTWRDAPQTPGDWSYRSTPEGSAAHFGAPQGGASLSLLCQRASRTIQLVRAGTANGTVPITIRTTNGDSAVSGQAQAGGTPGVAASIAANDPLLDAIAFSRGRFAVEVSGMPTLYVPAWPEIIRVIEDCR